MNAAATAGTAGGASHFNLNPVRRTGAKRVPNVVDPKRPNVGASTPKENYEQEAHDVDITVPDGHLTTITAERSAEENLNGRSEFAYGSFVRSVRLPADADEDDITASYDKRILTVSVGLSQPKPAEKRIPAQSVS
jgi:hypothetical protein